MSSCSTSPASEAKRRVSGILCVGNVLGRWLGRKPWESWSPRLEADRGMARPPSRSKTINLNSCTRLHHRPRTTGRGKVMITYNYIGCDVSKQALDLFDPRSDKFCRIGNDAASVDKFVAG